jgi:hypothetical protein
LARQEDLIDATKEPESLDELVRDVDAVARGRLLAEAEEVVDDLEAIVEQVDVEADTTGRFLDAEAAREWAEALGKL